MRIVPVLGSTCRSASKILPFEGRCYRQLGSVLSEFPKKTDGVLGGNGAALFCARTYSRSLIGK